MDSCKCSMGDISSRKLYVLENTCATIPEVTQLLDRLVLLQRSDVQTLNSTFLNVS